MLKGNGLCQELACIQFGQVKNIIDDRQQAFTGSMDRLAGNPFAQHPIPFSAAGR
jgi:hypothetical protein